MNASFILLLMVFCHVLADYNLQGWLASGKQKSWWMKDENVPRNYNFYQYDYTMALLMHSFSWSFMIMLPIAFTYEFCVNRLFIAVLFANLVVHYIADNAKANLFKINLVIDQTIHIVQIVVTFVVLILL